MKLFPIVPVGSLSLASRFSEHLLLEGLVRKFNGYADFYKARKESGDYLVLDAGGYEREDINYENFLSDAEDLRVEELQVPDFSLDTFLTLRRADEFFEFLTKHDPKVIEEYRIQLVPQGRKMSEYKDCLWNLVRMLKLFCSQNMVKLNVEDVVVGVSKNSGSIAPFEVTKTYRTYVNRPLVVELIHKAMPKNTIHLLGMQDPIELFAYRGKPYVRGMDTATPISHALLGHSYAECYVFDAYSVSSLPRVDLTGEVPGEKMFLAEENFRIVAGLCEEVGGDLDLFDWRNER